MTRLAPSRELLGYKSTRSSQVRGHTKSNGEISASESSSRQKYGQFLIGISLTALRYTIELSR